MKAICAFGIYQLNWANTTAPNATLCLIIRHASESSHHQWNPKSCEENSPSSGQSIVTIQNSRMQVCDPPASETAASKTELSASLQTSKCGRCDYSPPAKPYRKSSPQFSHLDFVRSVRHSSELANTGFLTYIPPAFSRVLHTKTSRRELSKQKTFTLNPSYIFRLDVFLQSFSYTGREQKFSHKSDVRQVHANEAHYFGRTLSTGAKHSTLLG